MGNRHTYYSRVCQFCHIQFTAIDHKHQMYCSVVCKIKGARPKQKANARNQFGSVKEGFIHRDKPVFTYTKGVTHWVTLPDGTMSRQTYHGGV